MSIVESKITDARLSGRAWRYKHGRHVNPVGWTMECRWTLWVTGWLVLSLTGCSLLPNRTGFAKKHASDDPASIAATHQAPNDMSIDHLLPPPDKIKPQTLVALADLRLQASLDPNRAAQERDLMQNQARLVYQRAIEADPKFVPAYQGLARLYAAQHDMPKVMEVYRKVLSFQPNNSALWYDLGVFHAQAEQIEEAFPCLEKAIKLDPDNRQYRKTMGFMYASIGRIDESLEHLKHAMPEAQAHYNLGCLLAHMGHRDIGQQHLEMAVRIDPTMKAAHEKLQAVAYGKPVLSKQELATVSYQDGPSSQAIPVPVESTLSLESSPPNG